MKKASYENKALITEILYQSFKENKSVNYIVKQDSKRENRIKSLMDYSFDVCYLFGDIYLSEDDKACALVLYPEQKKATLKSISLDIKLMLNCIGIGNIAKALNRESKIKEIQPKEKIYYLWFIGVDPRYQGKGIGSKLMEELIKDSEEKQRPIYLETSTLKNIPWYKKFGFEIYHELEFSYKLFFLKRLVRE
jgi:ribosomal protein S18 acetylase RimI-like enzyme